MGNWVIIQTNLVPSKTPLSVVAISQANSSKITRINPIPLEKGQISYFPSPASVDSANNMIYSIDGTAGKIVGIKFDPTTGKMSIAWGPVSQNTFSFLTLIGPANQRVLVATNFSTSLTQQQIAAPGFVPSPSTWKEQIIWRDAAAGRILAESSYFSPMSQGILITPGYGGLMYDLLNDGHIMALQVAQDHKLKFDVNNEVATK